MSKSIMISNNLRQIPFFVRPATIDSMYAEYTGQIKPPLQIIGRTSFVNILSELSSNSLEAVAGLDQLHARLYSQNMQILEKAFENAGLKGYANEIVEAGKIAKFSLRKHIQRSNGILSAENAMLVEDTSIDNIHDIKFAIGEPHAAEGLHCAQCMALNIVCQKIYNDNAVSEKLKLFLSAGESRFNGFISHVMRSEVQRSYVEHILDELKSHELLVICDFKMKFLRRFWRYNIEN